ncbi:mechanosensitive ion channel family protein [Cohaesibacter celericrescens]|uniref:Small-conductance mechanosensitive channel n=1 Tax=Cohaesibacter celericrescens TaxID=2067669 RepID=A0A2N5XKN5_9HYPH|nr:mechanosensitive ion channel domain-containing protein [Cohaesibacter celericrescens]PLW75008.1 mechanosensitive ion channel protein MscS [Cohaesibacter celericrescens]
MNAMIEQLGVYAPLIINVVKAVIFLVVGYILAGLVSSIVRKRLARIKSVDPTIGNFFASLARWLILVFVFIAVLQLFGFQATSLVAVLGAASLAIGLALQGTLSDVASGVMLIIFRPYKLGDYIDVSGTAGTVKNIDLFVTELATPDNVQIIMPNSKAWGSTVSNYSAHATRRVDLVFGIDYGDDMDKAMGIILDLANADDRVMKDPEPWTRVTNLGDSSVDLSVRLWCASEDYWDLKFAFLKAVKETFDAKGISIPYPHQVEIQRQS